MQDLKIFYTKINFAPINTGFALDGVYTEEAFDFYRLRSGKNIHKVYIGNIAPSLKYSTNPRTATFEKNNHKQLVRLKEVIEQNGSIPVVQIGFRTAPFHARTSRENNRQYIHKYSDYIAHLSYPQIINFYQSIANCLKIASDLGFSTAQIHAAHGYFISLLLCETINNRKDEFSYANIAGIDILLDMIASNNTFIKTDIRINMCDGLERPETELLSKKHIIQKLYQHSQINQISLSNGIYDINKNLIYTTKDKAKLNYQNACILTEGYMQSRFEICGRCDIIVRDETLDLTQTEFEIAVGRGLIANPHLAEDLIHGDTCIECNKCHYFSHGNPHIYTCNG